MRVRSVHRASIEAAAAPSSPRRQRVPPVAPPRPVPRRPSPIGTTGSSGTASPGGVMSLAADRGPSAPRHVVSVPCLAPPRARRQRTTLLAARGLNHPFEERAKKTRAMTGVTGSREVAVKSSQAGCTADPAAVHARLLGRLSLAHDGGSHGAGDEAKGGPRDAGRVRVYRPQTLRGQRGERRAHSTAVRTLSQTPHHGTHGPLQLLVYIAPLQDTLHRRTHTRETRRTFGPYTRTLAEQTSESEEAHGAEWLPGEVLRQGAS